jgi:hypothetical protein
MQPVVFEWREVEIADPKTGEVSKTFAMVPLERFAPTAKRQFQTDQKYRPGDWIVGEDVRSTAQHKRYFAALREAFDQLPETISALADGRALPHWLLIEANWKDEKEINCEDETQRKAPRDLRAHRDSVRADNGRDEPTYREEDDRRDRARDVAGLLRDGQGDVQAVERRRARPRGDVHSGPAREAAEGSGKERLMIVADKQTEAE